MRLLRPFVIVASLVLLVAGVSAACTVQSAFVSGKLNENGAFEIVSALDSEGSKIENMAGKTFTKVELSENVAMPASSSDELVYLVADIDFDNDVLRVASSTSCAKTADAAVASAKARLAGGAGCCASKASAASAKTASVSNAGSSCSASAAKSASYANAGSSCGTSAAKSAGYANAGSSCGASATKAASAESAGSKDACGADCVKACCAAAEGASMVVFNVSGMTCGGCASKIETAVKALEMEGIDAVVVDVEAGTATVQTSGKVCTKTLESAITEAGFPAEIAQAEAPEGEDAKS